MKTAKWLIGISVAALCASSRLGWADVPAPTDGGGDPPLPWSQLDTWAFSGSNWASGLGYPAVAWTNALNVDTWASTLWTTNGLLLDTGDPSLGIPGFLQFNVFEADGTTNLSCSVGAVCFWFSSSWSSVDQGEGATGPGTWGRLIEAGAQDTNNATGWWSLYLDPGGTNLYFSTQAGGVSADYLTAPISWTSNSWHQLVLSYSTTNCALYVDGQLQTNNLTGVFTYPDTNVLASGFYVGSDAFGLTQARGQFAQLSTWTGPLDPSFLVDSYAGGTNAVASWDSGTPHPLYLGNVAHVAVPVAYTGPQISIMNLVAVSAGAAGTSVSFQVGGGTNGPLYSVFMTTNLMTPGRSSPWQWLTNVPAGQTLCFTNLPWSRACFILGTPSDSDGDGLTDAYDTLVLHIPSNCYTNLSMDAFGTPMAWYLAHNLDPLAKGVATADADHDGLLNWQEYLWGSDPQTPEGFSLWISGLGIGPGIP